MSSQSTAELRKARGRWQWGPAAKESGKIMIPIILWTLHDLGGSITDRPSGRCGAKLIEEAQKRNYAVTPSFRGGTGTGSVSAMLAELESGRYAGCIAREKGKKRTYKITLLLTEDEMPERPFPVKVTKMADRPKLTPVPRPVKPMSVFVQPVADHAGFGNGGPDPDYVPPTVVPDPPARAPEPIQPELPENPDTPDVEDVVLPQIPPLLVIPENENTFDLLIELNQLAARALIASSRTPAKIGPSPEALDEAAQRLAATVEENQRLRTKVNILQETVVAKGKEAEALRKALMLAQGNLKAIQDNVNQGEGRERALARLRDTERTMQARPAVRG